MIIWSLSGINTCTTTVVTSLFVHGICVLVPGTHRSIGDVPFDVIGGTRARQAIGVLDHLGCPKSPFTVYIAGVSHGKPA